MVTNAPAFSSDVLKIEEGVLDPNANEKPAPPSGIKLDDPRRPSNVKLTGRAPIIGGDSGNLLRFEALRLHEVHND